MITNKRHPIDSNPVLTHKWETEETIQLYLEYIHCEKHERDEFTYCWDFNSTCVEDPTAAQLRDVRRLLDCVYQSVLHMAFDHGWADDVTFSPYEKIPIDSGVCIHSTKELRQKGHFSLMVRRDGQFHNDWSLNPTVDILRFILHMVIRFIAALCRDYKVQIFNPMVLA